MGSLKYKILSTPPSSTLAYFFNLRTMVPEAIKKSTSFVMHPEEFSLVTIRLETPK